jgi:glycerate kinase
MRILVAPDKFRGTLTARQAVEAIATGWRRERPHDELDLVPMADGGEGTMDTLVDALGGRRVRARVPGPLGDPVEAPYGLIPSDAGVMGVVETAAASGLALISEARRDPMRTTTAGTGRLMREAIDGGAKELLVCLGGSATNDGGTGMASALGYRFLDAEGAELGPGGGALVSLARIDAGGVLPHLAGVSVVGACDVDNPLTGPVGASATFGPQKGASAETVSVLDHALGHLAAVVHRDLGVAWNEEPGAGAAGGLGFGLLAFCGARLRPGVEVVMKAVALQTRIERADLVITGEGSFDEQSLHGKTPAGVLDAGRLVDVPVVIVCGRASIAPGGVPVRSLVDAVGERGAMEDTRAALTGVAQRLAEDVRELTGTPT